MTEIVKNFIVTTSPEEARYLLSDEWGEWQEIIDTRAILGFGGFRLALLGW